MITSSDLFLRFLVNRGIEKKLRGKIDDATINTVYVPRVKMELEIFSKVGISDYFLILYGIYDWCRQQNIPTGPGRGSAAGCLVSYLIGITQVDPIPFNLLFERFYNAGRMETRALPDIDFDVSQEHRDRIINDYLIPTYGSEYVAPIGTFGKMQAKSAVKHIGRVLRVPLEDTNRISNAIPEHRGKVGEIDDVIEERDSSGAFTKDAEYLQLASAKYPELFKWVPIVDGMQAIQNESVHAAGIIVSPRKIGDYVPLRWTPSKKLACTSYDMYELEHTGALKLDLLGLRNLDIINNTIQRAGLDIGYHDFIEQRVDFNDEKTWKLLRSGYGIGVFQFESNFMRTLLRDVQPENIEDLSAINALGRPGPLDARIELDRDDIISTSELPPYIKKKAKKDGDKLSLNMIEVYIARKKGELKVTYLHPLLEPILRNTYGVIVYQEQVMRIATDLGGFSLSEADGLRKIMGKKLVDKMPGQFSKFEEGCRANGISNEVIGAIWEQIKTFAEYGFNKCLAQGTLVRTNRGKIAIEDVVPGDMVMSASGKPSKSAKITWRKVLGVHENGVKECLKIETKLGNQHVCTPNHRLASENGFVEAKALKVGDVVYAPKLNLVPKTGKADNVSAARFLAYALFTDKMQSQGDCLISSKSAGVIDDIYKVVKDLNGQYCEIIETGTPKVAAHFQFEEAFDGIVDKEKRDRTFSIQGMSLNEIANFLAAALSMVGSCEAMGRVQISTPSKAVALELKEAFLCLGITTTVTSSLVNGLDYYRVILTGANSYALFEKLVLPLCVGEFLHQAAHVVQIKRTATTGDLPFFAEDKIADIYPVGSLMTYDLEVEGDTDEEHCFFADGLLTHNSHSVTYSVLAYITAYMKVHYTAEFMASLISSDNDINKRSVWINDATEVMHLKVSPPDVNKSKVDFIAGDNEIVFGLKEIKGMGSVAVNAIIDEREKNGPFKSLIDFYNRVDLGQVNSARFKALAQTGAFNCLHPNRAELLEWDELIRERKASAKSKIKLRQDNIKELEELITSASDQAIWDRKVTKVQLRQLEEGKKSKDDILQSILEKMHRDLEKNTKELKELEDGDFFTDLPSVPDMTLSQIIQREAELLGIQISGTLATPFVNEISMYSQTTVGDLFDSEYKTGDYAETMCGVFADIRVTQVKSGPNKGKEMVMCDFIDLTGKIKCLIFSKLYTQVKKILMENKPFIVEGKLSEEKDAIICFSITEC